MSMIRQGKGFTRPAPRPADAGDNILIVVEGEVTEPAYFDALLRLLELKSARVLPGEAPRPRIDVFEYGTGSDPRRLVDFALRKKREQAKAAADRNKINPPIPYNSVWIVFDTDAAEADGHLAPALAHARAGEVEVASTTPSFEFWLLLHFASEAPVLTTSAQAERRLADKLREHGRPDYAKSAGHAATLMPWLVARTTHAVRHAAAVRTHRAPGAATARSDVDHLVRRLNANAAPSRRLDFDTPREHSPIPRHLRR